MILSEPAPAKLNLALHVRGRRADGYHELETLFAFTTFGDAMRAKARPALRLDVAGAFADAAGARDDNLALRAAHALAQAAGVRTGAALMLDKQIPVAAGLGGGSADAAATLRLLDRLWGLDWGVARLAELARGLGADVPACVESRTCVGRARGDRLEPSTLDLAGTPVVLVNPRVAVPTRAVFAGWDGVDRGALDPESWMTARNDLESPALAIAPVIGDVLAALQDTAPRLARMSGSGATCFALYATPAAAGAAAAVLAATRPDWWVRATELR